MAARNCQIKTVANYDTPVAALRGFIIDNYILVFA